MSDENIPLKILKSMNTIERQNLNGNYKKEIVLQNILNNNEINTQKLVEDLIELLIDITKKKVKLLINSNKKCF